ncbi:Peroxiredoxin [hydrothermal vent metagenome]|uniref:Peroxiredoxin n=1 Tax=hydrothermal vent metagenome TaxID=652676 RepID=A0A3B0R8X7_9ZZZZ
MTIQIGDTLPDANFMTMTEQGPTPLDTDAVFKGKTVALLSLPGAFTPTCSAQHLPGFQQHAKALRAKGVDSIVCTSVNDVFVLHAWEKDQGTSGDITMLADGNGTFVTALGLDFDGSAFGMGRRGQRFSLLVKDGVVTHINIEEPGEFRVSSAEYLLEQL